MDYKNLLHIFINNAYTNHRRKNIVHFLTRNFQEQDFSSKKLTSNNFFIFLEFFIDREAVITA